MSLNKKSKIMDEEAIGRALIRIAHEIAEANKETCEIVIIGIRNKGEHLGRRIAALLEEILGKNVQFGILDITLYRDDFATHNSQPVVHETQIDFDISGKHIILVDDVLYTGRTIRCALDALVDFGRPRSIQLAVLIDRGHRELPIRADYVGKNIPTADSDIVEVMLKESDDNEQAILVEKRDEQV